MKRIILAALFILLSWGGGFGYYIYLVQSYPINTSTITNAIVVLSPSTKRINYGIASLKAGYAPILFIAGIDPDTALQDILPELKAIQSQVIYGIDNYAHDSSTSEVVDFIITHNIKSIRLVAEDYELPREIEELTQLLPRTNSLNIVPHPIASKDIPYKILLYSYNIYLKNLLLY